MGRGQFRPVGEDLEGRALLAARPAVVADIVYTAPGEGAQALDVYRPEGQAPAGGWPVVLAIHGGGWRKLSKEQYGGKVAPALTGAGFAVVAPDYALSRPWRPSWPENVRQLREAVAWVRAHAGEFGLDGGRVAAMGESAGGHLAAWLGTNPTRGVPDPARVQAVVSFSGPMDLSTLADQSPVGSIAARQMIGAERGVDPAAYEAASPARLASPGDAPALILQGAADRLVPPEQGTELASALTQAGVGNRLVVIPGAGHGFGFRVRGQDLLGVVVEFLRAELAGPGAPG